MEQLNNKKTERNNKFNNKRKAAIVILLLLLIIGIGVYYYIQPEEKGVYVKQPKKNIKKKEIKIKKIKQVIKKRKPVVRKKESKKVAALSPELKKLYYKYKRIEKVYLMDGSVFQGVLLGKNNNMKLVTINGALSLKKKDIISVEYVIKNN